VSAGDKPRLRREILIVNWPPIRGSKETLWLVTEERYCLRLTTNKEMNWLQFVSEGSTVPTLCAIAECITTCGNRVPSNNEQCCRRDPIEHRFERGTRLVGDDEHVNLHIMPR